jgi:hypothetical protein
LAGVDTAAVARLVVWLGIDEDLLSDAPLEWLQSNVQGPGQCHSVTGKWPKPRDALQRVWLLRNHRRLFPTSRSRSWQNPG